MIGTKKPTAPLVGENIQRKTKNGSIRWIGECEQNGYEKITPLVETRQMQTRIRV